MKFTRPAITPGPWRLSEENNVWSDNGERICNTCPPPHGSPETNAQAIAAVPQMMEALELALIRLDELDHLTGGDHLSTATKDEIVSALQSAGYTFP